MPFVDLCHSLLSFIFHLHTFRLLLLLLFFASFCPSLHLMYIKRVQLDGRLIPFYVTIHFLKVHTLYEHKQTFISWLFY